MKKYVIFFLLTQICCSCFLAHNRSDSRKPNAQLKPNRATETTEQTSLKESSNNIVASNLLSEPTKHKIDQLITNAIQSQTFLGAVVLVAKKGNVVFRKAYGYSEIVPKKVKMTEETLFDVASMTKSICTTTAIMQLIEKGEIGLNDPVKKYIADFAPWVNGNEKVDITIQQLLTHSSGLSAGISTTEALRLRDAWSGYNTEKFVRHIATHTKRNFRPGAKSLYSCLNFIILQGILENVTKTPLHLYVKEHVFKPLKMDHSYYFLENEKLPSSVAIAPTTLQASGKPLYGKVHDPLARILNGGNSGNAGLFTNVDDIARFCSFVFYGNKSVLKDETLALMTTVPQEDAKSVGRVLGWELNSSYAGGLNKHKCICHTGYTGTSMVLDLESKTAVILLTNRVHPKDTPESKKALMAVRRSLSDIICADE